MRAHARDVGDHVCMVSNKLKYEFEKLIILYSSL